MIPRISKGSSAYGALSYDHGKGRRDEHENPHKVAGNVPGRTWRERAKAIDNHARTARPDVVKPLHRTSLRVSDTDRKLTDREWKQVANEYIDRMGFEKCPWEATRHADDHIHITVNRVQWDGKLASTSHDYAKAQAASRKIEKTHGLEDASRKFKRERPEVSKGEKESATRRQVKPEREQLRDKIHAAERTSNGTRASYEEKLTEQGVKHRANISKTTGRVSGYSYGLDGHTASPKGDKSQPQEQVWFKGSQLGRDYSWNKTQARLDEQQKAQTVQKSEPVQEKSEPVQQMRSGSAGRGDQKAGGVKQDAGRTVGDPQQGQPLTREQARDMAMKRAAERQQKQSPGASRDTVKGRGDNHVTQENDAPQPQEKNAPQPQGQMTREQARAEAARRAAQREQQRDRSKDQERGR